MSALESPRVNAVALQLLFMQIVFSALEESRPPSADARAADVDLPDNEAAFYHIEQLGYQVGQRLVERTLLNETKGFPEQLDVIKFLCKDYWNSLFGKSIDNLKTNHRGVYVLQDHHFNWISRFGIDAASSDQTARMAILYLAYPCGLLRGALANMGISATVTAEIPAFPQCSFQIRVQLASP